MSITKIFNDYFTEFFNDENFGFGKTKFDYPAEDDPNWDKKSETVETPTHITKTEIWTSKDGTQRMQRVFSESKSTTQELTVDQLEKQKKLAIENDDYEEAAKLRDKIKLLKKEEKPS